MYYICKFSETWLVYDSKSQLSKVLIPGQVETIRHLFPAALKESAVLDALLLAPISASKLQQEPGDAYFICRFASVWSLYDGYTNSDRALEDADVKAITELFPAACNDSFVLDTLVISPISASKLQALTSSVPPNNLKRAA